ncbi:MAG: hypothetical protein P3C10_09750 [Gemmatimonadota bacterium]|nr:hypothetical protein [Gemmatimonadota bacterium]
MTIAVTSLRRSASGRAEALIAGAPVWLEADAEADLPLDAIVSAFFIPALRHGAPLVLDGALSERLRSQLPYVADIVREWWGWQGALPVEPVGTPAPTGGFLAPALRRSALLFSGGVDSFFSLLRGPVAPDALVFVDGFDVSLHDVARRDAACALVRRVADTVGVRTIRVTTNVRTHPLFASLSWEQTHGGALAAIGHALRGEISHIIVSSTPSFREIATRWGSHVRLDTLWSSEHLGVLHVGATHRRSEKLVAIAGEPLVREHLRVCWEHRGTGLNCGVCEKCLRTQLLLLEREQLHHFRTFDLSVADLTAAVEALPFVYNPITLELSYRTLDAARLPRAVADAVQALIRRSVAEHDRRRRSGHLVGRVQNRMARLFAGAR